MVRSLVRCALHWDSEHGWGKSAWTGIAQTSMGETILTDTEIFTTVTFMCVYFLKLPAGTTNHFPNVISRKA